MTKKIYILDGSIEEQNLIEKEFLNTLTVEEKIRSQSSEFDYLDETTEE